MERINRILTSLENSFNTYAQGFSSRKLTAFVFVLLTVYVEIRYTTDANLLEVIIVNAVFIAFLLGMVTVSQILKFKGKEG